VALALDALAGFDEALVAGSWGAPQPVCTRSPAEGGASTMWRTGKEVGSCRILTRLLTTS